MLSSIPLCIYINTDGYGKSNMPSHRGFPHTRIFTSFSCIQHKLRLLLSIYSTAITQIIFSITTTATTTTTTTTTTIYYSYNSTGSHIFQLFILNIIYIITVHHNAKLEELHLLHVEIIES